ncbi:MAG TPA: helix-turn-helix transcriptional regulator [Candidatus Limnocylindrales bacterium]|nr:helix-turn-helix transcriptional regulator [Candidatus Limnocylindrales bacterium]
MGTKPVQSGPIGERIRFQLKALRDEQSLTQANLASVAAQLGRPMADNTLAKIETGQRRMDADDVVMMALALGTTPNRLLLGDEGGMVALTPTMSAPARQAWAWADGRHPLGREEQRAFRVRSRPLDPPEPPMSGLTEAQQSVIVDVMAAVRRASAAGLPVEASVALIRVLAALDAGHGTGKG